MYNKLIAIGRLTKDVDARTTSNGVSVANFSVATNPTKEGAFNINCVAWGKLAETCEKYLKKGNVVYLEGRLQVQEYKYGESKANRTVCYVDVVKMLDNKRNES